MRHAHGETIAVTRPGEPIPDEYDDLGNPVFAADTNFTVSDVAIAPQGSTETAESPGIYVVTGYDLYCPYGTEVRATDRLTVRGVAGWQMTGDSLAAGWRSPFDGVGRGVVLTVKRAS